MNARGKSGEGDGARATSPPLQDVSVTSGQQARKKRR